jgi:hypothetical protein
MKNLIIECQKGACIVGEILERYDVGRDYLKPTEKVRITDEEVIKAVGKIAPWGNEHDKEKLGHAPYFEAGGVVTYLWSGPPSIDSACRISFQ